MVHQILSARRAALHLKIKQQVAQPRNRADLQPELLRHILHGAVIHIDAVFSRFFLPVERDDDGMGNCAGGADQRDRLAHGGACGHHVVDDQHPAQELRADQRPALAMVFFFLAVIGKRQVSPEPRQLDGDCRGQCDTLVCRAENHVELEAAALLLCQQLARIKLRQPAQLGAIVEPAGIEKVRAHAPGLGLELPETQHACFDSELHEFLRQVALRRRCEILKACLPCRHTH